MKTARQRAPEADDKPAPAPPPPPPPAKSKSAKDSKKPAGGHTCTRSAGGHGDGIRPSVCAVGLRYSADSARLQTALPLAGAAGLWFQHSMHVSLLLEACQALG